MIDEKDTLAAALRAAGYDELADQLEAREAMQGRPKYTLADALRGVGHDDLAQWLELEARTRAAEVEGGKVESSLADLTAEAITKAGMGPRRAA